MSTSKILIVPPGSDASSLTGILPVAHGGTGVTASTGTTATVLSTSPQLVTPNIGVAAGASLSVTGDIQSTSQNGGPFAGFRNAIINGGMAVDQRNAGAAQTITASAALAYTVDRWYAYCTGANVTGQQVAGTLKSRYRYQFTGAASVTAVGFAQRIEAGNTWRFNGKTITISADIANSLLTTVTWTLYRPTTAADTFGTLASPTVTQLATGTFTVSSAITRYNAQVAIADGDASKGLQLVFTVGAQTSGTWTMGEAQLETGSSPSSFEGRPIGTELALCQRYLPAFLSNSTTCELTVGQAYSNTVAGLVLALPVQARVAPTGITISAVTHIRLDGAGGAGLTSTNVTFGRASTNAASLQVNVAAGLSAGNATCGYFNNASAYIFFTGAEL